MEGNLSVHKGFFKGFKTYFGQIEEPYLVLYVLAKKKKKGEEKKEWLKVELNNENVEVYPISLNKTDFILIVNSSTKYKFRALSDFNRI